MNTPAKPRNCLYCSKEVKGRKDKKFCNDGCRNSFHNDLNSPVSETINPIINILKKNRTIVLQLLEKDEIKVTREYLLKAGLDLTYSTERYIVSEMDCFFYFDTGIRQISSTEFALLYRSEFKTSPEGPGKFLYLVRTQLD